MSNVRTTEEYIALDNKWKGFMLIVLHDEKSTSNRKISMTQQIWIVFLIAVPSFSVVQIQNWKYFCTHYITTSIFI